MMLVHHFTGWLTDRPRDVLPGFAGLALTDLAAPAFAVTAGASLALFVQRSQQKGMGRRELRQEVLRRYGALVPIGMALTLVALSNPFYFGVLDALGWGALITYAILRFIPSPSVRSLVVAAMFVVSRPAAAIVQEAFSTEYLVNAFAGKFPVLEYAGFAVVGALLAPQLASWTERRVAALAAGSVAVAAVTSLLIGPPDRYEGGLVFVIPGLAGTAVLYALMLWWRPADRLERALVVSGTRSLGIFVSHYGLFVLLRAAGLQESLPPVISLLIALALTAGVVVAALLLPPLPFSLRKGSASRREVRLEEGDSVLPDLVPVGGRVRRAGEHDETVIDLRDS